MTGKTKIDAWIYDSRSNPLNVSVFAEFKFQVLTTMVDQNVSENILADMHEYLFPSKQSVGQTEYVYIYNSIKGSRSLPWRLNAGILEPERKYIASHLLAKHIVTCYAIEDVFQIVNSFITIFTHT
jgi:hypothetical protein